MKAPCQASSSIADQSAQPTAGTVNSLHAAAPDLLSALESLVAACTVHPFPNIPVQKPLLAAILAIKRAKGIQTWEEKLAELRKVSPSCTILMRAPGDWYVSCGMEHAHGDVFLIGDYGNGSTPEAAVNDHWKQYGDGRPFHYKSQWFRWNGFMWEKCRDPRGKIA